MAELINTPITNIEIDLHGPYKWNPLFLKDIEFLKGKSDLTSQQVKLYRWMVTSHGQFLLKTNLLND